MDFSQLTPIATLLVELGLAAGAWRLATALKVRVDNHEARITSLEAKNHEARIGKLEAAR